MTYQKNNKEDFEPSNKVMMNNEMKNEIITCVGSFCLPLYFCFVIKYLNYITIGLLNVI